VINTTEKKTPVLLTGDDETVEITWNKTLEPGVYQLRTVLIGQSGDVLDLAENIIEAKPIAEATLPMPQRLRPFLLALPRWQ
jgi:hypothetical protein